MIKPPLYDHCSGTYFLVFIFCIGLIFSACKDSHKTDILDLVYIEGIHDDPAILRADSFFLNGKLEEAASLFKVPRQDASKQLYCQARLAEMDYYLRELYGLNHVNNALNSDRLPSPSNPIDSFFYSIYYFYTEEDLDSNYLHNWDKAESILGKNHFLINLGNAILGENYATFCFDNDSSNIYFGNHFSWCSKQDVKIYDGFWTLIRLTSNGTFYRDNLSSLIQINQVIEDTAWKEVLDTIHLSLAYSSRGFIQFRFPRFEEAFADNLIAISFSENSTAIPVYQEAIKSQMTVTTFWKKDSLWQIYSQMLENIIKKTGVDYVNYNRLIARFYFEKNQFNLSLPNHEKAIEYCMTRRHINLPVLSSLFYNHSVELEFSGNCEKAIQTYLISELGYLKYNWSFEDVVDTSLLRGQYAYVSFSRLGHIYYTWYTIDGNNDYLEKAEILAKLAHSSYYRTVETIEENVLLTFAIEKQRVLELFCLIYAEKYFKSHRAEDIELFYKFSEENRGAIFSRDMKAMWHKFPLPTEWLINEQRLKAENKRILEKPVIDQARLQANNDSIKFLLNRIIENYPEYYAKMFEKDPGTIKDSQDTLKGKKTSIISFDVIGNDLYLLWITELKADLIKIYLDEERVSQLETLISFMSTNNTVAASEYALKANKVWEWMIPESIKSDVNESWVIIPDGYFHRINLEALVTSIESIGDYGGMEYLIYDKDITYSPSIKTWMRPKASTRTQEKVAAMSWSDLESIKELSDSSKQELAGSIKETDVIRLAYHNAKIFTGEKATKTNFFRIYSDPEISILHLAIHGYASSEEQDNIKLYFRDKKWGIDSLYGYDLMPLTSSVRTIILSACESGKGIERVGEGNYNLPRYFLINGASEVISSLWLVDDDASAILFSSYYDDSKKYYERSLRKSKIELIEKRNSKYAMPYFWANTISQK